MSEGPLEEAETLPAPAEVEEHEGLLENDLYLLTQGQEAPRNERSKRRKRASPETQHRPVGAMEPLALPAPADAAIAAEATADAADAAADAVGAGAGAAADAASPEMSPEDVAAEMERARKKKKFESKPVEARKEGDEGDWIHFPSLAAASRETGVPNGSIASLCTLQGSHTGRVFGMGQNAEYIYI
ncbi:unnamed protein product [Cladocopium goreaui]|uniref:Uncharacterized protein n=1 Tax=Cladocopium goreaui TaxID=2562237 RepID=A0A9P1GQC4_9DINO|nr:unnamed protein product [Cladocopium goreaui]